MAKISTSTENSTIVAPIHNTPQAVYFTTGIPFEVYQYFGVSAEELDNKESEELKTIFEYASRDSSDIGDVINTISKLELRLGQPDLDESKINRIFNYASLKLQSDRIRKEQFDAMRKYNEKVSELQKQELAFENRGAANG